MHYTQQLVLPNKRAIETTKAQLRAGNIRSLYGLLLLVAKGLLTSVLANKTLSPTEAATTWRDWWGAYKDPNTHGTVPR